MQRLHERDKLSRSWNQPAVVIGNRYLRQGNLVYIGTYGAQGTNSTELYVEDFLDPKPTLPITVSVGKQEQTKSCQARNGAIVPLTKTCRLNFFFDGSSYKPEPATAVLLPIFRPNF